MRRWIVVGTLVYVLLSVSFTLWAQSSTFTPSPYIYKIAAAGCDVGPTERVQSGFRVQNQVGIITALHGVLGCKTLIAEPGGDGQAFHELIIGKVDIRHDIAVLWSKELAGAPLVGLAVMTETLTIDVDETYQVIGYPFGLFRQKTIVDVKIPERTILGNLLPNAAINAITDRDSPAIDAEVFSVQAHLVPGHSGAPILNRQGQVVGIGNGGLDLGRVEMGWAIPWDGIEPQVVSTQVSQSVAWGEFRKMRTLLQSDSGVLFAYSTPEPPTSTPTITFTVIPVPSLTPSPTTIATPIPTATLPADAQLIIEVANINIRSGPGVNYNIISVAKKGDKFPVVGRNQRGDWWQICCIGNQNGWVSNSLTKIFNPERVPTVTIVPATLTVTSTPTIIPIQKPTPLPRSAIILVAPKDDVRVSGRIKFDWKWRVDDAKLPPSQAFELVFWKPGQDNFRNSFGLVAPTHNTEVTIDLNGLDDDDENLPYLEPGEYMWGIMLVNTHPYDRIQIFKAGDPEKDKAGNSLVFVR